jgi:5-formyltetrahydrofolate cyclo-ligase
MDKQVLREVYKRKRLAMSPAEVQTKSRLICRRLISGVDWKAIGSVCAFQPIDKLNEINIRPLTSRLMKYGINVVVLEPSKNTDIPTEKFDLILVPALAFDKDNNRLGWGGGWYDRFLSAQPQALKIGLAYQDSFAETGLPREPHDIRLDKVITEV